MKPNFGIIPLPLKRPAPNHSATLLKARSRSKFLSRVFGLGLVLVGNAVLQVPSAPVLAAEACESMSLGSEGDSVRALQKTLNDNGFDAGEVDGVFGQNTEVAVLLFQREKELDVDGEVGPATCTALIGLDKTEFVASSNTTSTGVSGSASSGGASTATPIKTPAAPEVVITPTQTSQAASSNDDDRNYQVVVPTRGNDGVLMGVRAVVSGATLDRTRLGTFVNAGSYANRYQAESISYALKARGLDARVVHK